MNGPPSLLFELHIAILVVGVLLFLFASLSSLIYLLAQRQLKSRKLEPWFRRLPPLETMDRWTVRALILGFVSLTIGIVSGIYLAHLVWPAAWIHDPKVICAVATWGWNVLILIVRYRRGWRGAKFFALILVGFLFLLLTFLGVFFVFPAEPHRIASVWISLY